MNQISPEIHVVIPLVLRHEPCSLGFKAWPRSGKIRILMDRYYLAKTMECRAISTQRAIINCNHLDVKLIFCTAKGSFCTSDYILFLFFIVNVSQLSLYPKPICKRWTFRAIHLSSVTPHKFICSQIRC